MPRKPTPDDMFYAAEWLDYHEPPMDQVADWLRAEAQKEERAAWRRRFASAMDRAHPGYSKTKEGKAHLKRLLEEHGGSK